MVSGPAMDRDYLVDLFSQFGFIALRRMFSGYGIVADGVNFAMALRAGIIFRVDDQTVARYEAEGAEPFQYDTKNKTIVVKSYRHLPERLYDDPEELAVWAREAVEAAKRAAAKKSGVKKKPAKSKSAKSKSANSKPTKPKSEVLKPTKKTKKTASRTMAAKRRTSSRAAKKKAGHKKAGRKTGGRKSQAT
ncbi:TfoX/Sxy family protein [Bradyrhizobium sp. SYSU BS000235]|uniref:TfoX/Sxy family protein n=1 Tax=Bradyrhizobium sp. SYSU BS000235 TaxID=3411332 RepID=UPI003C74D4D5